MNANNESKQSVHPKSLVKRALQGAGLAILLAMPFTFLIIREIDDLGILVFLPMLTTAVGGSIGGIFYYLMDNFRKDERWNKILVNIICLIVYIITFWISLVFAFSITGHWD